MPAKEHPWFKFYGGDWLSDAQLRTCTDAERGILMDLMCLGDKGTPYGFLTSGGAPLAEKEMAKSTGLQVRVLRKRLTKLLLKRRLNWIKVGLKLDLTWNYPVLNPALIEVCSRVNLTTEPSETPIYFIPRMVLDGLKHQQAQVDGLKGGSPLLQKTLNPTLNPPLKPTLKTETETEEEVETEQNRGHEESVLSCRGDSGNDNDTTARLDYMKQSGIDTELARENNGNILRKKYLAYSLDEIRTCWSHAVAEDKRNVLKGPILAFFYALLKQGFSGSTNKAAGPIRKITCLRCLRSPLDDPKRCPDCSGVGYWLVDETDARVPIETTAPPVERKASVGDATSIGDVLPTLDLPDKKEPPAPADTDGSPAHHDSDEAGGDLV